MHLSYIKITRLYRVILVQTGGAIPKNTQEKVRR